MQAEFATPDTTDVYSISGLDMAMFSNYTEDETAHRLNMELWLLCRDQKCGFEIVNGELLFSFKGHNLFDAARNLHRVLMAIFRTGEALMYVDEDMGWHIRTSDGHASRLSGPLVDNS